MAQEIITDYPPLYEQIRDRFGLRPGSGVIFSWGDRIFNPDACRIGPHLLAHEAVHGERQGAGQQIEDWWKRYIDDAVWRLKEEIPAHQAEYRWVLENGSRRERRRALKIVANRLASPLYGKLIGRTAAEAMLRAGAA